MRFVQSSEFRDQARKGTPNRIGVKLASVGPVIAGDDRTFRFVFSDGDTDLSGDQLNPDGWDTANFEQNPVVLWSHDATQPIGRASNLAVEDGRLLGDITFATTPLAEEIYQLVKGNYVRAVSVGFLPIKYRFSDDPNRNGGIDYEAQSLLEVSVCAIPCNPRALIEAQDNGISTPEVESWLVSKIADTAISQSDRAVYKTLLNTKDSNESDPAEGGALVGNCGRDQNDDCGMKDPQECEVHRDEDEDMDEVQTLMAATNVLKLARAEIKRLNAEIKRLNTRRKDADMDEMEDKDEDNDPEVMLAKGLAHVKAAEELHDSAVEHMKSAHKCFKCMKSEDDDDMEEKDEDESDDDMDDDHIEKIKARAVAAMSR